MNKKHFTRNDIKNKTGGSLLLFFSLIALFGQEKTNTEDNLINQYIQSKGQQIIVFEPKNIKTFWIDKSIASIDGSINVSLNISSPQSLKSVPLKVQLINVRENQNCRVEVISGTEDFSFEILNGKSETVSSSQKENSFINYSIATSSFSLEDIQNMTFNIRFASKNQTTLSIKRILLSFSDNENSSYLFSPGKILYNKTNIKTTTAISGDQNNSFKATGKEINLFSQKKIIPPINPISASATVKNIGNTPTKLYFGYALYNQNQDWLNGRNYPYSKDSKSLRVVSSEDNSKSILVEGVFDWSKGCYLAINAKDDLSDIPNLHFAGVIADVKKQENGLSEIILDAPLKTKLNKDTKVRIHGKTGAYLYTKIKTLQPGEEYTIDSTIQKDESEFLYATKKFPKGVYYVIPVLLSYSAGLNQPNTILISNYEVSF